MGHAELCSGTALLLGCTSSAERRSLIIVGASSVQIAFYFETGGEIKWGAAGNFAHDPAAAKLLLSGGLQALLVAFFIIFIARVVCDPLYRGVEGLVARLVKTYSTQQVQCSESKEDTYDGASSTDLIYSDSILSGDPESLEAEHFLPEKAQNVSLWLHRVLFLAPVVTISILLAVRPRTFPYPHMSGSLPFTLFDMWSPYSQDMCQAGSSRDYLPFPLPDFIAPTFWEPPDGKFPGWMPGINSSEHRNSQLPSWLPRNRVPGFARWYHRSFRDKDSDHSSSQEMERSVNKRHRKHYHRHHKEVKYDPVEDPLRISNLDGDILGPIAHNLEGSGISIKHVVILSLESTRKDVFPLKKNSHIHEAIMQTHGSTESAAEAYSRLAALTRNAEILTGESDGYDFMDEEHHSGNRSWRNLGDNKGGINIVGAVTGSSSTFKSMLGSHCGAQPLPVDFTVEAGGPIYQPCLPSILQLFNLNKESHSGRGRRTNKEYVTSMPWKSVFVQSITEQYDRQDELNRRIGFDKVISKETLLNPSSMHPPTEPEVNYFGFPESQIKPYLHDVLRSAKEKNERLFLSHFTSSTHHPWNMPEAAGETVDYLKKSKWRSEHPLNRYLNTIKYQDEWIGEVMDMLEVFNMAEETLVVMVGDQ